MMSLKMLKKFIPKFIRNGWHNALPFQTFGDM